MGNHLQEINQDQYESLIQNYEGRVILDFYSSECSPCEALAPKFEETALLFGEHVKFYKIFRQQSRELANRLNVKSSPTLLFFDNGKEVAPRLTGGIRKRDILNAISGMIPEEQFQAILSRRERIQRRVDVVILGGGPAGLTAAIYAAQAKLKTIVVDPALPGGQVSTTHLISNFPGTGGPVSGWELMDKTLNQAKQSGAEILGAVDISDVRLSEDGGRHLVVVDETIQIEAGAVILAMGSEPRRLGIPGERELKGKGISYCATCDGKYYEDKEVVVIGGGNSAVEESLFLTRFATKVTVVHQFDRLQANMTAQEHAFANEKISFLFNSEPRRFETTENGRMNVVVESVQTGDYRTIETDGVFIFIGMAPNIQTLPETVERNRYGYIPTDDEMKSNLPGVFAAGDIRDKKIRQAATAVSDGAIAGIFAERYIEASDLRVREEAMALT
jgi:thioredoxin reductase (NADPH)